MISQSTSGSPGKLGGLLFEAIIKMNPAHQVRNPVMFVVCLGSALTLAFGIAEVLGMSDGSPLFTLVVSGWLWLTVYFSNFAEACAEGRGRAQAESLKRSRSEVMAKKIAVANFTSPVTQTASNLLVKGNLVLVDAGETIPGDGEVVVGAASVDESAITGESAPVVREAGGDRSSVTGGTKVLSDRLIVKISANPGESFLDQMIAMVEGAKRQRTPNEIALTILLVTLTIIFVVVCATLLPFSNFGVLQNGSGTPVSLTILIALLVCLAPTTIGGLVSAIGIAGMSRLQGQNVIALSGRAVEAAGDVDVLLLDKTGTITFGNRQAVSFTVAPGTERGRLIRAALLGSLPDETPEGKSIVVLATAELGITEQALPEDAQFIPFSAETRMSGVDIGARQLRKGSVDAITASAVERIPLELMSAVERIAKAGGTPLLVMEDRLVLGAIELKDVVKPGIRERFKLFRTMGIRTVMVTGDNPLTAASIAAEAGVDDFLAEATPERKLQLIRAHQAEGKLVAMMGDGTNDSPALAQADVAIAMNSGTQAAKEAANMVDLDSNPTKLLEVVETGKQLLITRGALTTFSIANDVAKYFAIIPAAFATTYPALKALDVMGLGSSESAVLSAVIFNAIVIPMLIPLALRGVKYEARSAAELLSRHLFIYGFGGLVAPFLGIKLIDLCIYRLFA